MNARWVGLGLLFCSGCTCGIALCDVDSDCGIGGSCDPSAGVCLSAPSLDGGGGSGGAGGGSGGGAPVSTLALKIPALTSRPAANGAVYEDSPAAWQRGDQLYVWLEASRPLSAPVLKVAGIDASAVAASFCTEACTGNCYCFAADLSRPPLPALRGAFALIGSGVDPEGKTLTATESIPVTRLHWKRALGAAVRGTPAIGNDGTVFVGTAPAMGPGRTGSLFAIGAGGEEKWNKPLGRIEGSVLVSAPGPTPQRLYVGSLAMSGQLTALDVTGAQVGQCALSKDAEPSASPSAISQGAAFFAAQTRELIAFRPTLNPACEIRKGEAELQYPDSLVSSGTAVFFVDEKPVVRRFDLGAQWTEYNQAQWPGAVIATYRNKGLAALSSGKLVGAGDMMFSATVFQAAVTGSFKFEYGFAPPRLPSNARGPVVAADGLALVGTPTGIAAVSTQAVQIGLGDRIANTPALGQGGRLYALAENGALSEWTYEGGKPIRSWSASLEATASPAFEASPALDCARTSTGVLIPGRPGILYAASRSGTLYAITVDAHGIDTTAQWPKYQKDPRNTGAADTGLQEFACP